MGWFGDWRRKAAWERKERELIAELQAITDQARAARAGLRILRREIRERAATSPRTARPSGPPDYPRAWRRLPRRIIFLDVETTGFGPSDRIVSLGSIRLSTDPIDVRTLHLVFNPERRSSPRACAIHGLSNKTLKRQDVFAPYARPLSAYLGDADLIVAHNAAFDLRFLNGAFAALNLPQLAAPHRCTMLEYRALGEGPASLDTICGRLALPRGRTHSALEDAWLTMQVFMWLNGCPYQALDFATAEAEPANFRPEPPKRPRRRPRRTPVLTAG